MSSRCWAIMMCTLVAIVGTVGSPARAGWWLPVCTAADFQIAPAVSGSIVVWEDYRNIATTGLDIYGYDLATNQEFPICTAAGHQSCPAIFADIVVWRDARNDATSDWDIYGYDLATNQEFPICTAAEPQSDPAIFGAIVVWTDGRNDATSDWDIYGYDLATNQEFPICTAAYSQGRPAIAGDIVVWHDERNDATSNGDIYGYNLATNQEFPICTAPRDQWDAAISGDIVVWTDRRNHVTSHWDIYGHDLATNDEFPICTAAEHQSCPAIFGDIVVWQDQRNYATRDWDIYGYDLATNQEFPICTWLSSQTTPAVSDSIVVWEEYRSAPGGVVYGDIYGLLLAQPPTCEVTYAPASPTTDDIITLYSGAADGDGSVVSVDWDFGDGAAISGDPVNHQYAMPGIYAVTVTVCDNDGYCTECTALVTVSCLCDVAIDRTHCKMPAAGRIGQCKTGQIGARNMSLTEYCDVVMRVTDNAGVVVFESQRTTIAPGQRLRLRFGHCYTADEVGRNLWTWEVWPADCAERTPWDNVRWRRVNVQPGVRSSTTNWQPLWRLWCS